MKRHIAVLSLILLSFQLFAQKQASIYMPQGQPAPVVFGVEKVKQALNDSYIYTDYEFQRYWCQNLMIGRLGYNPGTPNEVFLREFSKRFGNSAAPYIMEALEQSSRIIPRIISSAMPDFQEQRGVPEWGSGSGMNGKATLEAYSKKLPLDIQTFLSFGEAADLLIKNQISARVHPLQNADWYSKTANEIERNISLAEQDIGSNRNKEFIATIKDMQIMAGMARFHAERVKAAIAYQMYLKLDKSSAALDSAIYCDERALEQYRKVVSVVGDMYRTDLNFTVSDAGHWKDELILLEKAFEQLRIGKINASRNREQHFIMGIWRAYRKKTENINRALLCCGGNVHRKKHCMTIS